MIKWICGAVLGNPISAIILLLPIIVVVGIVMDVYVVMQLISMIFKEKFYL